MYILDALTWTYIKEYMIGRQGDFINFQKAVAVIVGSFLVGIGINGFLVPHHLIDGGVIGIALILHYFFGYQTGLSMLILSIPIFLYAWYYERPFFYSSVHGLLLTSLFMDWLNPLKKVFSISILTSSLIGGAIIGMGIGLMLRYETSSGGTDMLAKIIAKSTSMDIAFGDYRHRYTNHFSCSIHFRYRNFSFFMCDDYHHWTDHFAYESEGLNIVISSLRYGLRHLLPFAAFRYFC